MTEESGATNGHQQTGEVKPFADSIGVVCVGERRRLMCKVGFLVIQNRWRAGGGDRGELLTTACAGRGSDGQYRRAPVDAACAKDV